MKDFGTVKKRRMMDTQVDVNREYVADHRSLALRDRPQNLADFRLTEKLEDVTLGVVMMPIADP